MFALGKLADMQQISVGEFPGRTKPVVSSCWLDLQGLWPLLVHCFRPLPLQPWGTAQEAMREHGRAVRTMLQAYVSLAPPLCLWLRFM